MAQNTSDPEDGITAAPKKRTMGLGRGLNALLGDVAQEAPIETKGYRAPSGEVIESLFVSEIHPNPDPAVWFQILSLPNDRKYEIATLLFVRHKHKSHH